MQAGRNNIEERLQQRRMRPQFFSTLIFNRLVRKRKNWNGI
jgi:hypothetical protein